MPAPFPGYFLASQLFASPHFLILTGGIGVGLGAEVVKTEGDRALMIWVAMLRVV